MSPTAAIRGWRALDAVAASTGTAVVLVYVAVLWLPGLLIGVLLGLRSWSLTATAPLLTYAVAGLAGPLFPAIGIAWSPASFGLLVAAATVLAALVRWLVGHRTSADPDPDPPRWSRPAHLGVAAGLLAAAGFGAAVILAGIGRLSTVPQDWDAAFHANGIRWIAETGDSGLVAMGNVNWFEDGVEIFYPNAYHLVAAVVFRLTGADIPTVLNAHTVLIPGLCALVVVALVHRFRGRPVLAVAAALCSVTVTSFYDMLWRGPLLPYATGAVLTPLAVVLLIDLLDADGWRSRFAAGLLFALGLLGLICLNPAMLFAAALFALPAVVQRWAGRPDLLRTEPLVILAAGAGAALLSLPQLLGSLGSAGGELFDWPADLSQAEAIGELLTLSHGGLRPEWWLVIPAVLGLVGYRHLARLRWIGVGGAVFGVLFVLAASSDAYWVKAVTRPWWNDRWRLIGLCVIPVAVLAGHGIAEVQRWVGTALAATTRRLGVGSPAPHSGRVSGIVATVAVLALFVFVSNGLYVERNVERMGINATDGPAVSALEVDAMRALGNIVPPGERVLNDRADGSAWMYAIAGVLPVAGHYEEAKTGPDARMLALRFNEYPNDPEVRAAVARLRVTYVMVDEGYLRSNFRRATGLEGLDGAPWLEEVYRNPDAVIYRIRTDIPARP